jgi:hypothetical protein
MSSPDAANEFQFNSIQFVVIKVSLHALLHKMSTERDKKNTTKNPHTIKNTHTNIFFFGMSLQFSNINYFAHKLFKGMSKELM